MGLGISRTEEPGGEAWHTQKLPGIEITKPFPKTRCLPYLASTRSLWLKAMCASALSRGLSQSSLSHREPVASLWDLWGDPGAGWEGQALGTQRPLKDELQSVEVGREGEGQDPLPCWQEDKRAGLKSSRVPEIEWSWCSQQPDTANLGHFSQGSVLFPG